jgi:antitoxin (DNA-binding transcriptional repressor) of toxin-antitoxin stability system
LVSSRFFTIFAHKPIKLKVMIVISTRDFRTNQTKFLDMANNGEDIVLKSRRNGSFKLVPVAVENTVIDELRNKVENLVVTDDPDTKLFSENYLKEFMSIPAAFRVNPFDVSPSGDLFFADRRNLEHIEKAKNSKIRTLSKEEQKKLLSFD